MKGKKALFLFLALLLPVVVFLFLKRFAKNEFNVPVLYEDSIPAVSSRCDFKYRSPYHLADSVLAPLKLNTRDSLFVLYYGDHLQTAMNRIAVEFEGDGVRIASTTELAEKTDPELIRDCVLLMAGDTSVTLVDNQNQIRGHYVGADRDDVDRLIVEIKIILKKY